METVNSQAGEAVLILMALWWLCGGYVFPVVVKPETLTLMINLTFKVKVNHFPINTDFKQNVLKL